MSLFQRTLLCVDNMKVLQRYDLFQNTKYNGKSNS